MRRSNRQPIAVELARQDMTQRFLAAHTGIHKSALNEYVNGRRRVSRSHARRIAKVLGVPVRELFDPEQVIS